jgi:cellulose synthase/poly-beta-1,6-N-acetylglucosamine synthase-like glycosyltransferase
MAASIIFWACAGLALFTYVGYPLVLGILVLLKRDRRTVESAALPTLSALVVGRNDEARVVGKIRNILDNGYPADRLEVIVCSDGSTDGTNDRVSQFGDARVRLAASPTNVGVNEAFALGAAAAKGEVLLLTDSGALLEPGALAAAARHFADPRVGLVSGHIEFRDLRGSSVAGGYRAYWSVETVVRRLESDLGLMAVVVGAFEMVRREAYIGVPSELNNDVAAPFYARSRGFRCRYEPGAVIVAEQKKTVEQDFARRVRMALRAWSTVPYLARLAPVPKNLGPWAVVIGHKYLRYLVGVFLLGLLAANAFLLGARFYQVTFGAQVLGYAAALAGWALAALNIRVWPLALPFYFCLLQTAGIVGLVKALAGKRVGTWKPVD